MCTRTKFESMRLEKGVSLAQMAADLRVSESHIRGIERGRNNPTLRLAFSIARYFNATIEEVFEDAV
ncbi:hypothetical protein BK126_03195 [Paenibacillus sp. FSL H7-0326]|uniref:helix-turn-helix transcriptional regulator n=1 Tax=Paenibacillus sp. FSL H7-0326 TaxID=1921144 RepID=UPI00096C7857|nr:helix-turn-helix domain-containing protein [Paenibacillus sp. FSL H7-0326]OMC71134.1 hypothetical protein BK126_03195 [Paenibacillus sp. FSL H7-0326]